MDTEDAIDKILETDADTNHNENEKEIIQEGYNQCDPKSCDQDLNNIGLVIQSPQVIEFFKPLISSQFYTRDILERKGPQSFSKN